MQRVPLSRVTGELFPVQSPERCGPNPGSSSAPDRADGRRHVAFDRDFHCIGSIVGRRWPEATLVPVSSAQVLVVDDNEAIRTSVSELLRSAGYSVMEAADGQSALDLLTTTTVGVVLLDLKMPGGGGLAVLEGIDDPPPVILMSAFVLD